MCSGTRADTQRRVRVCRTVKCCLCVCDDDDDDQDGVLCEICGRLVVVVPF